MLMHRNKKQKIIQYNILRFKEQLGYKKQLIDVRGNVEV